MRARVIRNRRGPVLPRVIGKLLVVCGELPRENRKRSERKDTVGGRQRRRVRSGDQRRGGYEE